MNFFIVTFNYQVTVHSLSGCERNGFCQLNCLRQWGKTPACHNSLGRNCAAKCAVRL